jgi:hypothetical protein
MKELLRKILIGLILYANTSLCFSQDQSPFQLGADIMSRYIWRGMNLGGSSPSIQPWMKFDFLAGSPNHSLTVGAWGAYTFSNTAGQEVDLFLIYSYKEFLSFTITDYFAPGINPTYGRGSFFNFNSDSTSHVLEGAVSFNGTQTFPLTFLFAMNFYGNDARRINNDGSAGKIMMSNYFEAGYRADIGGVALNLFVGATLNQSDESAGEVGYYGNTSAGIINLGIKASKNLTITDSFSIPVQASIVTNPESGDIFLVFGFSF